MKEISYDQWQRRFALKGNASLEDDPDTLTFFDNGAVRNEENDFVIKCDQVSVAAPQWVREFDLSYDVPDAITQRLEDTSWHNDATPSFTPKGDDGETLRLFVDHPDPAKRQHPGPRFVITKCEKTVVETDSLAEVLSFLDVQGINRLRAALLALRDRLGNKDYALAASQGKFQLQKLTYPGPKVEALSDWLTEDALIAFMNDFQNAPKP